MSKCIAILCLFSYNLIGQNHYEKSFFVLKSMLERQASLNFKQAVFIVENTYLDNKLSKKKFENELTFILSLANGRLKNSNLSKDSSKDSTIIKSYGALFRTLTDTLFITSNRDSFFSLPYRYNFDDMFGEKDWSNMFVTKLLATHKGNCHSMPYLYKILCDELGIPCHLALSPNHIYIKHRSEKVGWYNTELTSASFPIDAWIMASGYIPLEAIQKGTYMEALDDKKCITLCVYDIAKGFDRKYPDNDGTFIIKCCDLALEHFPNFINALILKAETKKRQFERMMKARNISTPSVLKQQTDGKALWDDFTKLYVTIHNLGYRTMPEKMYVDWLTSLKKEKEKYGNKQVIEMNTGNFGEVKKK
jgi:hypothetical protein